MKRIGAAAGPSRREWRRHREVMLLGLAFAAVTGVVAMIAARQARAR
jgi:hypothetical protein